MRTWALATAAALAASWGGVAHADPLAYVRASSQLEGTTPDRYHPLNLVDDDPATVWCEGADGAGEGEAVRFTFKKKQRIDRIVIGPAATSGRVVTAVSVSDGANTLRVDLDAEYADVSLREPLAGTTFTVTIAEVGAAKEGARLDPQAACLAEVLLYYKRRPFGGKTPLGKLRYDARRDQILGRWSGEPLGAPERFLIFAMDGTWEWTYEPLLGGKRQRITGEYRFRGDRLLMRRGGVGRWADVRYSHRRVEVDARDPGAPRGDYEVISLNEVLGTKLAGEYNNAQF